LRHRIARLQLNRFTSWRKATLKGLVQSLFIHQSIRTTHTLAKAASPLAETLISLGKQNTLHAKREAFRILQDHRLVNLLFSEIAPRFEKKASGYTRIISLGQRRGDNAQVAILELTEIKKKKKLPKKEKEVQEEGPETVAEKPAKEAKPETGIAVKEKPPIIQKPTKGFFRGLRNIFKKERDSL